MSPDKEGISLDVYKWVQNVTRDQIRDKIIDLRDRRVVAGIKQGDLSEKLDTQQSRVSKLENLWEVPNRFTARYITVLCEMLNINFEE